MQRRYSIPKAHTMRRPHRSKPVLPAARYGQIAVFRASALSSFRGLSVPTAASRTPPLASFRMGMSGQRLFKRWRLVRFKRQADAAQQVLKARVSAKGIQLGVGGDPGRAVRALVEGFSQPQES